MKAGPTPYIIPLDAAQSMLRAAGFNKSIPILEFYCIENKLDAVRVGRKWRTSPLALSLLIEALKLEPDTHRSRTQ